MKDAIWYGAATKCAGENATSGVATRVGASLMRKRESVYNSALESVASYNGN